MTWINQNGLALYGAITGTAALLISFFSHRHAIKKDRIKLKVSFAAHPDKEENLERLNAVPPETPWTQPNLVELFLVTVRNLGSIPAPLDEVGIVDATGANHQALVTRRYSQMSLLQPLSKADLEALEPMASKTFSVYIRRDEPLFDAVSAYAIDQTGKTWRASA